jgi:hypothetical protein
MPAVKVTVGADGSGFERVMQNMEKRVHSLGHEVSHGLKEAFVGFVGAGSIGLLVENMVSYAESITRASERLGIATGRIQELRNAARHAGKDLDAFDSVFRNLDKSLSKSLVPGSKESNIADQLGLSQSDRAHLNKDDALKKMLEATKGMGRTEAEQLLGGMVGPKNAGWLIGHRESILSGTGNLVGDKDLQALVDFRHNLEDLSDVVRVALIPALTALIDWATHAIARTVQGSRTMDEMDTEAQSIYASKHNGAAPNAAWHMFNQTAYQTALYAESVNPLHNEEEKDATIKKIQEAIIRKTYGADVSEELFKTFKPSENATVLDKLKDAQEARRKEREEEQQALAGPVDRKAPVTKTPKQSDKELLDKQLKGGSELLKVGGLMGVDATYRLERLTQTTNDLLREISDKLNPPDSSPNTLDDILGFND